MATEARPKQRVKQGQSTYMYSPDKNKIASVNTRTKSMLLLKGLMLSVKSIMLSLRNNIRVTKGDLLLLGGGLEIVYR